MLVGALRLLHHVSKRRARFVVGLAWAMALSSAATSSAQDTHGETSLRFLAPHASPGSLRGSIERLATDHARFVAPIGDGSASAPQEPRTAVAPQRSKRRILLTGLAGLAFTGSYLLGRQAVRSNLQVDYERFYIDRTVVDYRKSVSLSATGAVLSGAGGAAALYFGWRN